MNCGAKTVIKTDTLNVRVGQAGFTNKPASSRGFRKDGHGGIQSRSTRYALLVNGDKARNVHQIKYLRVILSS